MPFQKGVPRPKNAGRKKGTLNKNTQDLISLADKLGVNPIEILLNIAKGDFKALGYDSNEIIKVGKNGETYIEERITLDARRAAAKDVSPYLFAQRKAVELSTNDEQGFKVMVLDYATKDKKDGK